MSNELQDLLQQVKEVDLSANNPEMQAVIEHEIAHWVKSYENKKEMNLGDCYGSPGQIPDEIPVNGKTYSPPQVLEHVKARDEVGMIVINEVDKYQKEDALWQDNDFYSQLAGLGKNLDEVVFQCACGQHNQTLRNVLQEIIHPNPDSILITAGMKNAIMQWYGAPDELWKPSAHMHILNEGEPSEKTRRDIMRIVEPPGSFDLIGVYLVGMYGEDMIYINPEVIPDELREHIEPEARFIVEGNLATKYRKDLKITKVELAPEPDPNDGLA